MEGSLYKSLLTIAAARKCRATWGERLGSLSRYLPRDNFHNVEYSEELSVKELSESEPLNP